MQNVSPEHRRNDFAAIQAVAIRFSARGPARVEIRTDLFGRGDANLADTAMRETREETGIDLRRDGTVIGTLDDLRPQTTRLPAIIVRPYVVLLNRVESLVLSDEVAEAFWVPLEALRNAASWRETTVLARGIQLDRRAFHHQGHVIWGMTERILAQLLALLD